MFVTFTSQPSLADPTILHVNVGSAKAGMAVKKLAAITKAVSFIFVSWFRC